MQLEDLLRAFDRVAANVAKLDAVWERAAPMIPDGPSRGSSREYDDLRRPWESLKDGLRPIDGWTVTAELPDADEVGQTFIDYLDIGEPPFALENSIEEPVRQLDEYRFRLGQARRRAIRDRLNALTASINGALPKILDGVPARTGTTSRHSTGHRYEPTSRPPAWRTPIPCQRRTSTSATPQRHTRPGA